MNTIRSLYHHVQRYRTLQTDKILSLPIVILMPHSACNCRCVMCDIWKDNKNLRQLNEQDISGLMRSLKALGTRQVLMSGGEALLNPNFFRFCEMLAAAGIRISLLSTGLSLGTHAEKIVGHVHDLIISLDGPPELHDRIRNIPNAYAKMKAGIEAIRRIDPAFPVSGRTVIQQLNFRSWRGIIESARDLSLDRISFLPADVSSHAFNREVLWSGQRQDEVLIGREDLEELREIVEKLIVDQGAAIPAGFIAESADKLRKIHGYYAAVHGLGPFPYKSCNAPWVSTVVEADGTVRPCFFHPPIGNIHDGDLQDLLNSKEALHFRRNLDMEEDATCKRCVCYLNLSPWARI